MYKTDPFAYCAAIMWGRWRQIHPDMWSDSSPLVSGRNLLWRTYGPQADNVNNLTKAELACQ